MKITLLEHKTPRSISYLNGDPLWVTIHSSIKLESLFQHRPPWRPVCCPSLWQISLQRRGSHVVWVDAPRGLGKMKGRYHTVFIVCSCVKRGVWHTTGAQEIPVQLNLSYFISLGLNFFISKIRKFNQFLSSFKSLVLSSAKPIWVCAQVK